MSLYGLQFDTLWSCRAIVSLTKGDVCDCICCCKSLSLGQGGAGRDTTGSRMDSKNQASAAAEMWKRNRLSVCLCAALLSASRAYDPAGVVRPMKMYCFVMETISSSLHHGMKQYPPPRTVCLGGAVMSLPGGTVSDAVQSCNALPCQTCSTPSIRTTALLNPRQLAHKRRTPPLCTLAYRRAHDQNRIKCYGPAQRALQANAMSQMGHPAVRHPCPHSCTAITMVSICWYHISWISS